MPKNTLRAAAEGMPNFNRRHILASLGAATALAVAAGDAVAQSAAVTAPAAPPIGRHNAVDPTLRKLELAFNAEWKKQDQALELHTAAEAACFAARPPKPEEIKVSAELWARYGTLRVDEISRDNPIYAAVDDNRRMNERRLEQWQSECKTIASRPEFTAPARAYGRQLNISGDAAERVLRYPARSAADMQVKMRVHGKWIFEDFELLEALERDIARIAKIESSASGVSRGTNAVTA